MFAPRPGSGSSTTRRLVGPGEKSISVRPNEALAPRAVTRGSSADSIAPGAPGPVCHSFGFRNGLGYGEEDLALDGGGQTGQSAQNGCNGFGDIWVVVIVVGTMTVIVVRAVGVTAVVTLTARS